MKVYVDNASTSKMSKKAKEVLIEKIDNYYGNALSLHDNGQQAEEQLSQARHIIAKAINAEKDDCIVFTSGGSEADTQAIIGAARIGKKNGKMNIITSKFEHHAVLHTLRFLKKEGFNITYLDVYKDGYVKIEDLKKSITDDTALVTIMYANNEIGTIQPIAEIGKVCREKKVLFHTDAVQAVGHEYIDVQKENIDMMSISAHKFGGPKGVGALYLRPRLKIAPIIFGGTQERRMRAGTHNTPSICSMAVALEEKVENIKKNNEYILKLRNRLIEGLKSIPHSQVNGGIDKRLSGNVNMCFEGIEGEGLLLLLNREGIMASSGSACTSQSLDPSHVLLAIGLIHDIAHGSLRLTLDENNTMEEIEYIIEKTKEVVSYLRKMSPIWDDLEKGKREYVIQ